MIEVDKNYVMKLTKPFLRINSLNGNVVHHSSLNF